MATLPKQNESPIWKIDFHDLAKQICLKDLELFKAITIEEINSFNWTKTNKKTLCPNLIISNKQFNKINLWVQKEILDQKSSILGIKVLSKFINLSKRLLDHKNYQSAYAVKSALHSTPIYRLEYLWSEISKKDKLTWEKLSVVFSVEDNYNNLRNSMSENKKPCIPFIGVYLSDLTGLDAAHPKVNGVEPEIRIVRMKKIYDAIKYFQSSKYDFKLHSGIQEYLHSMEYMEEFQNYIIDTLFNLSKALEPETNGENTNDSSHNPNSLSPHSPFTRISNFHPSHRKCRSLEANEQGYYRRISENEVGSVFFGDPKNSPLTLFKKDKTEDQICKIRNLLDDSVVESKTVDRTLSNFSDVSIVLNAHNGSIRGISPSSSFIQVWEDSSQKPDIETTSIVQYNDPDILPANQDIKIVIQGVIKRKVKIKTATFCMPLYQKVLARLTTNNLDCYLNFSTPKISKPKTVEDFRDDCHVNISLVNANLEYKKFTSSPKIIIILPHEIYILKAIDEFPEDWVSIEHWWEMLNNTINNVKSLKASVTQKEPDLIDLRNDLTRL